MDDESPVRIRPIWLLGGGALLAVLGLCALVSILVMVGLIWYSNQITVGAREATAILYQRQTAQAFQQVDRQTHEQQGIGLGLTLAHRLFDVHGGELQLKSVVGKGTRALVRLPVA